MQLHVIDADDSRSPQQKVNSALAQYVWAVGFFWEAVTREDVEAEFERRGAEVLPEPSCWTYSGMTPPCWTCTPRARTDRPSSGPSTRPTLAALRAGEGEPVQVD